MMFMAQGDQNGLIQVWKLAELHYNEPIANIKFAGQVVDIKFIQNKQTQLMLSLHNQPGELNVTSLVNFKLIRKVSFSFNSRLMSVHPNKRMIFIVPATDKNLDMAVIDLGFKHYIHEGKLPCLRDIMFMSFFSMTPCRLFVMSQSSETKAWKARMSALRGMCPKTYFSAHFFSSAAILSLPVIL